MSVKFGSTTVETPHVQPAAAASPSTSSATGMKMSMFKGKAGFVIPKNKFSGSLVPIFKGVKKSDGSDTAIEESSKQLQRKTKWGSDLTQDTSVRRGRALAYQTRVDQITQQLKSGSLRSDSQNSKPARDASDTELPTMQIELKTLQSLELERREAIGEILKLNPSYKAPSDYQPVLREATVPIPVKSHPDYDFLGLVYGADGGIQKKLEKETGTRIQVCGTKSDTKEKVEITASDGSGLISSCEEVYVRISSDTFEKVDAAAALIELLLSSVPVKPAASTTSTSVSGDNVQALSGDQDIAATHASTIAVANPELQPGSGPMSTSSQGPFPPYQSSWLPAGQYNLFSGQATVPSSMAFPFNPSPTRPPLGPGPPGPFGSGQFGSFYQNAAVPTPRLHTSAPAMPGSFMPLSYPFGQTALRNPSAATSPSSTQSPLGHQQTLAGSPRVPRPQLAERPLTPPSTSPGWTVPSPAAPQSHSSGNFPTIGSSQGFMTSQPFSASPTQLPSPQLGSASATSFLPSQMQSSSPMPTQAFALQAQLFNLSTNNAFRSTQNPRPPSAAPHAPSFTPLKQMGPTAPGPTLPGSGDFTFQPHRPQGVPSQSPPGPGLHFASQRPAPVGFPSAPQGPSFRPALQNTIPQHARQNFPGPPIGNQMGPHPGQFGAPSPNPHMGPRNLGPVSQVPNAGGPFPPRVGHPAQYPQSYSAPPLSQPGGNFSPNMRPNLSGRPQVYDPFSPSSISAPQPQGSNVGIARKHDTDPEYEDLMASVGVK